MSSQAKIEGTARIVHRYDTSDQIAGAKQEIDMFPSFAYVKTQIKE